MVVKVNTDIKNNFIANLSITKKIINQIKSYGDEVIYFNDKQLPNKTSNHTYLAVIICVQNTVPVQLFACITQWSTNTLIIQNFI